MGFKMEHPLAPEGAQGLRFETLAGKRMVLVVPTTHHLAGRTGVELAELVDETFADFPPGRGARTLTDRAFAAAGSGSRTIAYEVDDATSLVDLVRHGLAISILPPSLAEPNDDLVHVTLAGNELLFETALATSTVRRLSAAAAAAALADTARRYAAARTPA